MRTLLALTLIAGCSITKPAPVSPTDTTVELAARRTQMIGWLHDYRERGVFPTDSTGRPQSVFMDANGNRCPMAELIHKSGRDDLVAAVVKENNAVRLADVHEGPLYDWMLSSGLTGPEIAMIQGAADINFGQYQFEEINTQLVEAKAEVRGKLETAEVALASGTANAIVVASATLAHRHPSELALTKLGAHVVPTTAMPFVPAPGTVQAQVSAAMQPRRIRIGRQPIVITTPNGAPVRLDSYTGN